MEVNDLPEDYANLVKADIAEEKNKRKLQEREEKKAIAEGKVRSQ